VSEWVWVDESWSYEQVVEVTAMMDCACVIGDVGEKVIVPTKVTGCTCGGENKQ
jgi:hypothetical protein